jgi:hypothetical protein
VTPHRFASDPIDMAGPIQAAADQGRHTRSRPAHRAGRRSAPGRAAVSSAGARSCARSAAGCGPGCDADATRDLTCPRRPPGPSGRPSVSRCARTLEPPRRRRDRPAFIHDQTREPQTYAWGQSDITVEHEGLLVAGAVPS